MKKAIMHAGVAVLGLSIAAATASMENPTLDEYYHLGEYFIKTDQYDQAVANYRALVAAYPSSRQAERAWLHLGRSHRALMRRAISDLEREKARGGPSSREVKRLESEARSQMTLSLHSFEKAFSQFPSARPEALIGMALTYAASGPDKEDEALLRLKKVVAEYPEEAGRAQLIIGDTRAAAGDIAAAKEAYREALLSLPEVASLAMLKNAALSLGADEPAAAADDYGEIVSSLGVDGAYSDNYHPMGHVMEKAVAGRGSAERALGDEEGELDGYAAVAARHAGTRTALFARVERAKALWHYGKRDRAEAGLRGIAAEYPRSVWAMTALLELASLQGASPAAAETCRDIIRSKPDSIFWVTAQMALAETYVEIAAAAEDKDEKEKLRIKARDACKALIARYPNSPEAGEAAQFLSSQKLGT